MGQIATRGWIYSNKKNVSGWSGDNKCPTKSEIESADSSLEVSGIYASNQLVQQDDINAYGWNYYFSGTPTSISDNGAGGTYTIYVDSRRVWTVNGVETDYEQYVRWTFSQNLPWVTGVMEGSGSNAERLRVTITGGYQPARSGSISFQQTGTSNTFSVPVTQAGRYILRCTGLYDGAEVGIFNSAAEPRSGVDYPYMLVSGGTLVTYNDSGFLIADPAYGWVGIHAYLGTTVYARERMGNSWGIARQVTLGIDTTIHF
jgi:hypothetical protein